MEMQRVLLPYNIFKYKNLEHNISMTMARRFYTSEKYWHIYLEIYTYLECLSKQSEKNRIQKCAYVGVGEVFN